MLVGASEAELDRHATLRLLARQIGGLRLRRDIQRREPERILGQVEAAGAALDPVMHALVELADILDEQKRRRFLLRERQ